MKLFDTHAHLLDERFNEDREAVIAAFSEKNVVRVTECACRPGDIPGVLALTERYPGLIYGAVGVHPHHAEEFSDSSLEAVRKAFDNPAIVAVGEIGLDYHYDFCPRSLQTACFDAQLSLAGELKKPVIIHDREAHGDCMALLNAHKDTLSGVMHCFSGSYETACECLDLGLYLGIGGSSTFKNSKKLKEMLPKLPVDRLVLETDCPYMTPEPFRGKRNEPAMTRVTLSNLAALINREEESLSRILYGNSCRLFGLTE